MEPNRSFTGLPYHATRAFMISALIMAAFSPFRSGAQTGIDIAGTGGIDSLMGSFMKQWKISGGSMAMTHNGKLFYHRGFGFSDAAGTRSAQPTDQYRIASISKPITAMAIMKLVETEQLQLSDRVFGEWAILSQPYYLTAISDQRIYDIRVQDLLEHTSGWDRRLSYGPYPHSDAPFFPLHVTEAVEETNPVGDSTLIRFMLKTGLNHEPGTHYSYSNVGYLILGKIIERVTGSRYEAFVKENLLLPAGAGDTHLGKNLRTQKLERESDYMFSQLALSVYGDGALVPSAYGGFNLEAMNAHGGWVSTVSDLCRLLTSLSGTAVLQPWTVSAMLEPGAVNPRYARGWNVNSKGNSWHSGSLDGSASFVGRTPNGFTWAILFNGRADNSAAFWQALDRLPWLAMQTLSTIPNVDLFPPKENVREILAIKTDSVVHLNWLSGDGNGRMLIVSSEKEIIFPSEGKTYITGDLIGKTGRVVYSGDAAGTALTGLEQENMYYLTAFEFFQNNDTSGRPVYRLTGRHVAEIRMRREEDVVDVQ